MDQSFLKTQLDYWKNVYETLPPRLIMPSSKPRTSTLNPYAVSDKQELDSKLLLQIEDLKRKHALTDYMFYMACFYVYLSNKVACNDIVIASPMEITLTRSA